MHEEQPARFHPRGHLAQQKFVILHVLEHLDRHHPVEFPVRQIQLRHIGRVDLHIAQPPPRRLAHDVFFLCPRVGNPENPRVRILLRHPQGQGSPPAAQLEHALTVLQLRPLATQRQHRLFRFREGRVPPGPQPAAVFHARTEHVFEKFRRHLVVLLVRLPRLHCNRHRLEFTHKIHQRPLLRLHPAAVLVLQLAGQQLMDPRPDDKIRQQPFLQHPV